MYRSASSPNIRSLIWSSYFLYCHYRLTFPILPPTSMNKSPTTLLHYSFSSHRTCIRKLKPIFHWRWGSRWIPNANEIYTKNMKCTWPTPVFCVGTQRNLYSTYWRRGLASGKTQILALGNAKYTNMLVSPTQNSGVGGITQRQPPTPGILRRSGI